MSTLTPAESRRQYSWWWDSHNSPKNSKWLQDNLSDMDLKVKAMIKLIEEDADSFARRAEMYYKKRPELMKFVEEFYRAYRALAERYNHATGALSHAHRTIAEAFPNHIPPVPSEESPSISPSTEVGPCTPASPLCLLFDPDDIQKDALGGPGYFYSANMNVGYVDDASFAAKRGLKQVNEMFAPREGAPHVKLHEGKVRKGLNFQEQEESISHSKVHTNQSQILPEQEDDEKESTKNEIKRLQEEVSQLSIDNKKLLIQIESDSANSDLLRTEVQNLRDTTTKLESEKQSILLQDKLSREKLSIMENEIFRAEYEFGKLHEEIMMVIVKLCNTKEQCLLLEKENQTLILNFERNKKFLEEIRSLAVENQNHWYQAVKENENAKKEMKHFHEQFSLLSNENDRIKIQLQNETIQLQLSRADVHNMKDAMSKLKSEKKASVLQMQLFQKNISSLESKSFQAKNEIGKLHTEIFMGIFKLYSAQEQYYALEKENQGLKSELEERKRVLEEIRKLSVESQSFLEQEIKEKENIKNEMECLQRDISQLSIENQNLMSQMASESKILGAYITEVQNLRDVLSVLECEKNDVVLENQLSRESITKLGTEISRAKEEIRELHAEVLTGIVKFCSAEEQKLALESAYDHMKSEIRKNKEGLEGLRISLEESEKQRGKAERSLQSLERLYHQSQEKVEHMTVEIKTHFNKLKDTEHSKMSLEEEICQIKYVNTNLNERIIAYDSKLKHLQGEIVSLNSINCKLEDEIDIHLEDNKVLQQELECIINDRNELDIKHKSLMEQLKVASLNMESLEILVKELQFGCGELSEGCQKLEYEKLVLFNKVQDVESIYEKNAVLSNSLSDAMEKIRVLENSCESFSTKSSILVVEKAALASQIEVITGNMKILSEKNTILENSITNMNTQLEGLRLKLTVLQDSNQLLFDDNSNLIIQKNASISQVESLQSDLINVETKHAMLGVHYLNLEKEKDISVSQITKLEVALDLKNKEHTSLMQTSNISLASLENQIHLLQVDKNFTEEELEVVQQKCMSNIVENQILHTCLSDMKDSFRIEKQVQEFFIQSSEMQLTALERQINLLCEKGIVRDKEFDEEEHKYMSSMLENFFLLMCLSEMNEKKVILSQSCLQHMEAFRRASELISVLEGSKLHLEEKNTLLVEHNARLMHGIEILLESLNINKKLLNVDGSEDVFIQAIKGEINNLLACISDLIYDNQLLHTEFSVYHTFLERVSLEKVFLGQELGRMGGQVLVLQRDQDQLQERYEILGQDVSDKKQLNESLNSELESLSRLLSGLSKDFSNLREQNNALEEENSMIIEEATKLEHLYLFFCSSNAESLQSLKVLGNEIVSLVAVENNLKKETIEGKGRIRVVENGRKFLEESLGLLEEFRCRTTILEFDLFIARLFNEDLIHQVETRENLLKKKNMELLNAYNNLQCTQEELTKICTKLDTANKEVEEAKLMRVQFEDKIAVLLEGYSSKDVQIINTSEENRKLNVELNNLYDKVEVLRKSEHNLSSELQNKMDELDICEGEISNLFNEVQVSAVNNAFFEENMFEWAISSEFFDICALVQREMLNEGITLRNAHAFELKKKYDDLENENRELKAIWSSCLPLFISLDNGIAAVEKQARQLASLHEGQDTSLIDTLEKNIKETRTSDIVTVAETLELQNLVSKVRALEKLLTNTSNQLKLARLIHASNLEASKKEIEGLNMEETSDQDEYSETSRTKNGQLMKDIELDQVSNSNVLSRIQSAESEDQMLKLWETAEKDYNNSVSNRHGIEPVEEFSIGFPSSELIAEKELGVDKPEMPTKGSQEDWIRRIIERLSTDADKLSALKTTVKELEKKIENFGKSGKSSELDAVQIKVKQAEKDVLELVETEEKLRKKVDDYSKSLEKMRWLERRQMFEQARTVSDQIEKLETELQEIYYFIVNLDGVSERNKSQVRDRSPRVLLRDYIDGWRAGKARKKHDFCGCMRPKTEE